MPCGSRWHRATLRHCIVGWTTGAIDGPGWQTEWSSQTGVSQCGILHGSTIDMPGVPLGGQVDRRAGGLEPPEVGAARSNGRHSDGKGLLAHNGSSYANLFTGDAERAVLTMSVAGKRKENKLGAGYAQYFSRPSNAVRTLNSTVAEVYRERRAARDQIRRGVEPRVSRNWTYAFLRAFTTIISRDVCVNGVLNDMAEGRDAIYIDFLGYDEVSHHSGPLREDTLRVLRDIDRQIARFERAIPFAPRPYRIVVLSDHGQTQGATFEERFDESLAALVGRLCGAVVDVDDDSDAGRTESSAWLRSARDNEHELQRSETEPMVLASGNLGLVYLPDGDRRLTLEEIDDRYPALVPGWSRTPVSASSSCRPQHDGPVVISAAGRRVVDTGEVEGDDPLEPFGPGAVAMVGRAAGYATAGDVMVNSMYDAERDEVAAFEHQVSSHGGLGGPQTHPFVIYPADLSDPVGPIEGPSALHRVLQGMAARTRPTRRGRVVIAIGPTIGDWEVAHDVSEWIEIAAVTVIAVTVVVSIVVMVRAAVTGGGAAKSLWVFKQAFSRGVLLGLDLLIAADIIRTVTLDPTLENVAALGLLVVVRTFLSWALVLEAEGRWPWQRLDDADPIV